MSILNLAHFNLAGPQAPLFQRSLGHPFTRDFVVNAIHSLLSSAGILATSQGTPSGAEQPRRLSIPVYLLMKFSSSADGAPMPSVPTSMPSPLTWFASLTDSTARPPTSPSGPTFSPLAAPLLAFFVIGAPLRVAFGTLYFGVLIVGSRPAHSECSSVPLLDYLIISPSPNVLAFL
jgi:hypothetical protein